MKEIDNVILNTTSFEELPKDMRNELPDWCIDQETFQQYKEIIRFSNDQVNYQPLINQQVKLRLDELFNQQRRSNWYMFNFLAIGQSSNSHQKALWMGLAAVFMIALVSSVFIWQYAEKEPNQAIAMEMKKDRKADLNEIKLKQSIPTKQSKQVAELSPNVQVAEVQVAENTLESNKIYSEFAVADAEVLDIKMEAVSNIAEENKKETILFSLSDPIYNNLLDRIEPTF